MSKTFVTLLVLIGIAILVARFLFSVDGFSPEAGGSCSVGATAPNFSGVAVNGQVVHLSDLRGKVVVLDFWATWCPPCRGMIPHERELVKRLQGKPFSFIGVSADQDKAKLQRFLTTEHMAWPNICDGPGGPLQRQYNIRYYPTIYVLDKDGVIRFKDVRGPELDRAVDGLLPGHS